MCSFNAESTKTPHVSQQRRYPEAGRGLQIPTELGDDWFWAFVWGSSERLVGPSPATLAEPWRKRGPLLAKSSRLSSACRPLVVRRARAHVNIIITPISKGSPINYRGQST